MLNETLCDEDNQKLAHLAQVDFYMKQLLGVDRMSVDVYSKLEELRKTEKEADKLKVKTSTEDQDNFFMQDAPNGEEEEVCYQESERKDKEGLR